MRRGTRFFTSCWVTFAAAATLLAAMLVAGVSRNLSAATIEITAPNGNGTQGNGVVPQPDGAPSVFVEEAGGALFNYWYANGKWDAAEIVSSGVGSYPTAILQADGSPSVFFIGTDGSLWNYRYVDGTWESTEVATSGVMSYGPYSLISAPDVIVQGGEPTAFVPGCGATNFCSNAAGIWEYVESSSGTWSSNEIISASADEALEMGPAIVVTAPNPSGTVTLFVTRGSALWEYQAPSWTGAQVIPGGSAGVVTLQPDGYPSIFTDYVQGVLTSTQVFLRNYWYANGAWDTADLAAPFVNSDLAVTLQPDGSPSVFYLQTDALWNAWYVNGPWDNSQITTQSVSSTYPLSVTLQPDGSPSLFGVDPNGGLVNYWYVNGRWNAGTVVASSVGIPQTPVCAPSAAQAGLERAC